MSWVHLKDATPKIRKQRQCMLCCRPIEAGSKAIYRVGVRDGDLMSDYMHVACEAVTRDWDWMDWETFSPGDGEWPEIESDEVRTKQAKGGE